MMKDWIWPTLGALVIWGLWGFLPKVAVRFITPKSAMVYEVIGGALIGGLLLVALNFHLDTDPRGIVPAMATGMLGVMGAFLFLLAVARGPVSLVVTISALYPVLTILLAVLFLGESVSLRQGMGIVFALAAIGLVAS